jgi:hypothetical protein
MPMLRVPPASRYMFGSGVSFSNHCRMRMCAAGGLGKGGQHGK